MNFLLSRNNSLLLVAIGLLFVLTASLVVSQRVGAAGYAEAMAEADSWCGYYDNSSTPYAVSGYGWLSARGNGSGTNITVNPGVKDAAVQINFAGRHCKKTPRNYVLYMKSQEATISATSGNSNLLSVQPTMVSDDNYDHNQPEDYHQKADATLDVSKLPIGTGTYEVCMHWVPQPNYIPVVLTDVTTTCNSITITKRTDWTINGQSYIRKSTVATNSQGTIGDITPGTKLYWSHDLRASTAMDQSISYRVDKSGFSNGWNSQNPSTNAIYSAGPKEDSLFVKIYPTGGSHTEYDVTQADVGNTLCQRISWTPNSYNDSSRGEAKYFVNGSPVATACADVPYNFNLVPSIDPLGAEFADPGGTIPTVSGKVANDGPTKSYIDTQWQLSTIIVEPGGSIEEVSQRDTKQNGCAYYGNACTSISGSGSGEGDTSFGVKTTVVQQLLNQQIGDLEVGSKICYGMSVKAFGPAFTNASPDWRHSPAECVIIGKKPKVQIWGSDLSVGRRFADDSSAVTGSGVDVSTSVKDGGTKNFGSWVEYGVFATGTITGGSAAGLAGQDGHGTGTQADWSKLTFANAGHTALSGCNGVVKFGCYATAGNLGTIPSVAARLAPKATTSTPSLSGSVLLDDLLNGPDDTFYANGDLRIIGGAIAKGKSVIIKASGTVFIDGDIKYTTDPLSSVSEIPQVVIIANSIQIKDTVANIDAWLIANGTQGGLDRQGSIHTCNDRILTSTPVLTSVICDKKLTVNGPVMAKKLYLTRTAGSGTGAASGEPAEVLNLRADAYLWAIGRAGGEGSVQTIDTRELAPRF